MSHAELLRLVEAHEKAEKALEASCFSVWAAFSKEEPALAHEILQLFSSVDAAAQWTATSVKESGMSPAREAAEGRATEIMAKVRKTDHGFVG